MNCGVRDRFAASHLFFRDPLAFRRSHLSFLCISRVRRLLQASLVHSIPTHCEIDRYSDWSSTDRRMNLLSVP
jgi:hypothetical protein